jgi:hypothetical protein
MNNNSPNPDPHELMPDWLAETIPPLRATQNGGEPVLHVKWSTPDGTWTFYVIEYDPNERLCFGLVDAHERQLSYFRLDDVERIRGPSDLRIERDLDFSPTPLLQLHQDLDRGR